MKAISCYQTKADKTVVLKLLTKEQHLHGIGLSSFELNVLAGQQFEACLGHIGIITHTDGETSHIYVGAGDGLSDAKAIAAVARSLPLGCYSVESSLSHAALVAWSLSQYRFDRYQSTPFIPRALVVEENQLFEVLAEADAVFLVRDLINMPANDLDPKALADIVAKIAATHGAEFNEWVGDELLEQNFPAIHTVGKAAAQLPRLLSLTWGEETHPRISLVGKGVCFDSGGLDLKPCAAMRLMKKDMGGAAQVIGLAQWLMTHQVPIRLQVLIPAIENAVDAQSYRPGDILTMRNGLTVEVDNTDAEGRLILADALVKACEDKPELIVDFATLTGAARVAVGTGISAMFVKDDKIANDLTASALKVNDPIWRLPLFDEYEDLFSSSIADFANSGSSPYAGAITAALFLQRFITTDIPWIHFDVMAWNVGNKPGKPEGGEAMGMRAVGQYLRDRYS